MAESYLSAIAYWTYQHPAIAEFQWRPPSTAASSPVFLVSAIAVYLLGILVLSLLLANRKSPEPLGPLPVIHNLILFFGSSYMFAGCLISSMAELGVFAAASDSSSSSSKPWQWIFCFPPGTSPSGPVFFWSYMYYLSKYYELLDTVIMIMKKRTLTFLHVFHHAIVVLMSFFWLQYSQSLQIIALLTNTSVHMLMYSYYLLCSLGIRPPWKKIVTNCQIVQFVFSFAVSLVMIYLHFHGHGCAGFGAWIFNAFFNASLLVLFMNFHRKQYKDGKARVKRDHQS